jgi:hypothetical protein
MEKNVCEKDLRLFVDMSGEAQPQKPDDLSMRVLVPAFMISELKRAFEIGFLLFLPFLIIDLVVASVLMSMGCCRRSSAALQADLVRAGRRLDAGRRLADPELRDLAGEPLPWRAAPIAARRDAFRKFATPAPGTPGNFRRYPADIRIGERYGIRTWRIALAAGDTAANHHSIGDFLAPLRA